MPHIGEGVRTGEPLRKEHWSTAVGGPVAPSGVGTSSGRGDGLDGAAAAALAEDEGDDEEDEEDEEEDFADAGGVGGDAAEAEDSGDHGDDEEHDGPVQHGSSFRVLGSKIDEVTQAGGAAEHVERVEAGEFRIGLVADGDVGGTGVSEDFFGGS